MKLLLAVFVSATSLFATTLTGTLNGPDGTGINGTLYMSLSQQAALLSTGGCGGPVEIVPGVLGPQSGYSVAIKIVGGAMQGTPAVYGNDCMLPGGLYYNVQLVDNNGNTYFTDKWQIVGSSVDVGTIVSVVISGTTTTLGSTGFVQLVPAGTQIINQPASTYLGVNYFAVTGTLTLPDGTQCTSSGCFANTNAVTVTGNQTIGGNKQFTADILGVPGSSGPSLGTIANPFFNGVFGGTVSAPTLATNGSVCGLSGFPCFVQMQAGGSSIANYSANATAVMNGGNTYPIWTYTHPTTSPLLTMGASLNPGNSAYNLGTSALPWNNIWGVDLMATGTLTVGPVGNFYNRVFSAADISCTGVNDGWQGLRTDTQKLEFCVGGARYGITVTAF